MDFLKRATELQSELIQNRRQFHQNPEIGMDLPKTSTYVMDKLKEMGYEPKLIANSGVTATVGGKNGGKVILLRADMDALPMREESGLSFASTGNCAHTCGHDMHTAMLLGAAKLLKETEDELAGTVKFMFQPAEETLEGARAMIEAGILANPQVDSAIGAHMAPMVPAGFVGWSKGTVSASSNVFSITIKGKGGHGASPAECIDPINVGAHLHIALQEIISREVSANEAVVLTFGKFHAGDAPNIIPETAVLSGTLRTYNTEVQQMVLARIKEIAESVAKTFRATAIFEEHASTLPMMMDDGMIDIVGKAFKELFGQGAAEMNHRMSGSEDFAEVTAKVPSMFFVVGGGSPEQGYCYGAHHPKVAFDEKALAVGAAAYAQGAVRWLEENSKES